MQTKTSWSLTQSSQPDLCIFITPHIYKFKLWDLLLNQKKSAGKLQFFHIERHIMRTKSHANIPVVKFRSHHFCKFSKTFTWIDFDHVLHLFDVTGLETCSQLKFCSWHKQGQPVNNYQQQWQCGPASTASHFTSATQKGKVSTPPELTPWDCQSLTNIKHLKCFSFPVHLLCQLSFEVRSVPYPRRKMWDLGQSSQM